MNNHGWERCQKTLGRSIILAGLWASLSASSLAASTDISDVPLAIKNSAKPNIMFILDNSGSMDWRSTTGTDGLNQYSTNTIDFYSSLVNKLYYDPDVRYSPPVVATSFSADNPEGVPMGNATVSSPTTLKDPYLDPNGTDPGGNGYGGRTDLTIKCYYSSSTPPLVPTSSNCRSYSSSYRYGPIAFTAYYYQYTGGGVPTPGSSTSYVRRDIISENAPFARAASRTDCSVSGSARSCSYAQEIQNFANWYSYYRTRILTMKTTMGQAFAAMGNKYRVGFSTINNSNQTGNPTGQNFRSVSDFTDTTKRAWYTTLYGIDPLYGTPLQKALQRVGEYYSGAGMGYSGDVGDEDPVQYSCQQNFAILSTDGYWNSNTVSIGNQDRTVPSIPASALNPPADPGLTAGARWPRPIYEGPTATSDTLADVAAYYWVNDLRPGMKNNVPTTAEDRASWQHMTTFTIGLGVDGSKPYRPDYDVASSGFYRDLVNGADDWPKPEQDKNTAVDDLWHAAVNGHGRYFSAKNPNALRTSLRSILDDIINRTGAASAVAVANANITTDNASYASKYNSGAWTGDLLKYLINVDTGIPSETPIWSAQAKLDESTVTPDNRKIVTYSGVFGEAQGVQFRPASAALGGSILSKLSIVQQAFLNSSTTPPGPSDGEAVLQYLRGERSLEGSGYRTRSSRLGDIINAEPVVVGTPVFKYTDPGYRAFREAQDTKKASASREQVIFQAANDGMVHAFRAVDGAESWAYIPNLLFNGSSKLRDLSKQVGFSHQYYVDATPVSGDADFGNTCPDSGCPRPLTLPTPDWRTVLVGGLGKGGRGYYALDVTTPTADSEIDAASKVLWEFPNSDTTGEVDRTPPSGTVSNGLVMNTNKIGYTFGRPIVTKTKAHGWVALLPSGYNNGGDTGGDGKGYLFVVNLRTGKLLHVFDTTVGDAGTPSGLAFVSGFVEDAGGDNTVLSVYGGDLLGNVWRFDLSDKSTSNWKVKKLAALVDTSGVAQSVTTEPELASVVLAGFPRRLIFVGTGQYLGDSDIPGASGANIHAAQRQTMYALVDDLTNPSGTTAVIPSLRSSLQQQTLSGGGSTRSVSGNAVDYSTKKGWYIDLPDAGERVNTSPVLALRALVFTSNIPNSDVCSPGGSSWLNIVDYKTGAVVPGLTAASWSLGNVLASRPILIQRRDGSIQILVRTSTAETLVMPGPPVSAPLKSQRVSWREIGRLKD